MQGRSVDHASAPLPDNAFFQNSILSRSHAKLSFAFGQVWIQDLGSSNGTFLNGVKLEPHQESQLLCEDDILDFGHDIESDDEGDFLEDEYKKVSCTVSIQFLSDPTDQDNISSAEILKNTPSISIRELKGPADLVYTEPDKISDRNRKQNIHILASSSSEQKQTRQDLESYQQRPSSIGVRKPSIGSSRKPSISLSSTDIRKPATSSIENSSNGKKFDSSVIVSVPPPPPARKIPLNFNQLAAPPPCPPPSGRKILNSNIYFSASSTWSTTTSFSRHVQPTVISNKTCRKLTRSVSCGNCQRPLKKTHTASRR